MKEDRYLYRKILSSAIVMSLFATVVWIAGGMLGYYWNGFQAQISGLSVSWLQPASNMQGFNGSTVFYLLLVVPVVAFAVIASQGKRGRLPSWPFQFLLIIPLFAYLCSAIFEVQILKPIGRAILDVDVALDYAVYAPFALLGFVVVLYLLLVMLLPSTLGTRIVGILTVLICGLCYIVYAAFIIYNHMMSMLGGSFTTVQFGIYMICFACDAVTFFFMMSVYMTFCNIRREDKKPAEDLPLTRKQRKQLLAMEEAEGLAQEVGQVPAAEQEVAAEQAVAAEQMPYSEEEITSGQKAAAEQKVVAVPVPVQGAAGQPALPTVGSPGQ
jgi:hypothetical protein